MAQPSRVSLSRPGAKDLPELLALARGGRSFHRPWLYLSQTPEGWQQYLERNQHNLVIGYLLRRRDTRELVGVVNLNEVVRGVFQSAYLGFYACAVHAHQGFMLEGLSAVVRRAFGLHRLHRVEANIQPGNMASQRLVSGLGFQCEGFSPRYLKIGGQWRDHERWALTREAWGTTRGTGRRRPRMHLTRSTMARRRGPRR